MRRAPFVVPLPAVGNVFTEVLLPAGVFAMGNMTAPGDDREPLHAIGFKDHACANLFVRCLREGFPQLIGHLVKINQRPPIVPNEQVNICVHLSV